MSNRYYLNALQSLAYNSSKHAISYMENCKRDVLSVRRFLLDYVLKKSELG